MEVKDQISEKVVKSVWKSDLLAGFLVFLIALPLSLGIAKASGFPAAMGVLSAIIGGIATVFFKVADLSIKGPAAGLITICAASVATFGGDTQGWEITASAVAVMAVFQMLFGVFKFGIVSNLFPHTAIQGMLAAIGLIIIAKQIPVLLGVDPSAVEDSRPLMLYYAIPEFVAQAQWQIAALGILGLLVVFGFPALPGQWTKRIPAPLILLVLLVPLSVFMGLDRLTANHAFVEIGDFWGEFGLHADFSAVGSWLFWKFVIMLLLVGSIESLLTVKAIDSKNKTGRRADVNGDLIGLGFGNVISGLLGGLPMISEVVRSSSNMNFGAKSKWSNFFHGLFLLLAMAFFIPFIEMIPNSALAALLIAAGYHLVEPKNILEIFRLGWEQRGIFITTVVVTLLTDLLLGILFGIMVKVLYQVYRGVRLKDFIRPRISLSTKDASTVEVRIKGVGIFSHLVKFQRAVDEAAKSEVVILNFENCTYLDHSFVAFWEGYKKKMLASGVKIQELCLENLQPITNHPLAPRVAAMRES